MNAPQKDIDKIRSLVASYYDGLISTDELKSLVEYFKSVDREALPGDIRDDAELIMLSASAEDAIIASMPEGLENKVRAVSVDKIERHKGYAYLRYFAKPVAAAAMVALLFVTMWLKPVKHEDVVIDQMPTISVRFAIQADDEPMIKPGILTEEIKLAATPVKEKSMAAVAYVSESKDEADNYIEITNIEQASMLTQDALALVRRKLAVAGYSIGSASVGLRHIDETMRDVIVN